MISTVAELKELIIWAKEQGLLKLQVGDISIEVSQYELAKRVMEDANDITAIPRSNQAKDTETNMMDTLDASEDDEALLFHSAQ